jgi:hypothetical protein
LNECSVTVANAPSHRDVEAVPERGQGFGVNLGDLRLDAALCELSGELTSLRDRFLNR